ncbi:MAG: zinc ribbon domain-containing protein [Kiritimatiellales bacterium]|nr:zinc ribbon domain-containing protein [Kiritimatiellales bacterium]
MPIFEYQCQKCGAEFEKLVPNADTKPTCERCGAKDVERQLSTFSAMFAGSRALPCSDGACPTGQPSGGCAGGECPFS